LHSSRTRYRIPYSWLKPDFSDLRRKNELDRSVLIAFLGAGWHKLRGKINLDLKGHGGLLLESNPAVFWQTEQYSTTYFLSGNRTVLRGFPGTGVANGARFGRIFLHPDNPGIMCFF